MPIQYFRKAIKWALSLNQPRKFYLKIKIMKKSIALLILCCIGFSNTEAQLLKKLKEKAEKAMEQKKPVTATETNTPAAPATENSNKIESKTPVKPPSYCDSIFVINAEETFLYDESEVFAVNNQTSYAFVVQNNKYEYFVIENGIRTGPFKESPVKSVKVNEEEDGSTSSNDYDKVSMGDDKDPIAIQYSKTINGKLFIVFNGKNYGPYDHVGKMIVSRDKKQFFALVTIGGANAMTAKMGMGNNFMVNEGILKQKAGDGGMSMAMKFSVSKGFKHCMAVVMDQTAQKVISITSTNKTEEGSMEALYSGSGNISFVNDNGDIVSVPTQSPTQILLNGKEVASFKVPIKSMSRLFITPDISKSVYYEKGKLYKADGTEESLSGILFPKVITIKNITAVYFFKIYKNDSGARVVYLCKKEL